MTQPDFSSPGHRLDNLKRFATFHAYADLRDAIHTPAYADKPISDLRQLCVLIERQLAGLLGVSHTGLLGALLDVADRDHKATDAKDEGGSATG